LGKNRRLGNEGTIILRKGLSVKRRPFFHRGEVGMNPAGVTLEELLMLPVLKDARVISGKQGLCRVVQFIDIMEVSDIDCWLREGELLLTIAYSLRNDLSKLPKVVEMLAKANAAALAIKPEEYLHAPEMIEFK
jgi:hypothetical protein